MKKKIKPGELITKYNSDKAKKITNINKKASSKARVSIMGLA